MTEEHKKEKLVTPIKKKKDKTMLYVIIAIVVGLVIYNYTTS